MSYPARAEGLGKYGNDTTKLYTSELNRRPQIYKIKEKDKLSYGWYLDIFQKWKWLRRETADGIELPTQEKIKTFKGKENYEILGILEADAIKPVEMKDK